MPTFVNTHSESAAVVGYANVFSGEFPSNFAASCRTGFKDLKRGWGVGTISFFLS